MGLFSKNNAAAEPQSQRAVYLKAYESARSNILLVLLFTLINLVLLFTNSNSYFLFSAYIPYMIGDLAMYLCGRYPVEYYEGDVSITDYEFFPDSFFYGAIAVAVVIMAVYVLFWLFSKKEKYGWLVAAIVFFAIDTVILICMLGINIDNAIDLVFHAWVIVSLASGINAAVKLKKLPPEEDFADDGIPPADDAPEEDTEENTEE